MHATTGPSNRPDREACFSSVEAVSADAGRNVPAIRPAHLVALSAAPPAHPTHPPFKDPTPPPSPAGRYRSAHSLPRDTQAAPGRPAPTRRSMRTHRYGRLPYGTTTSPECRRPRQTPANSGIQNSMAHRDRSAQRRPSGRDRGLPPVGEAAGQDCWRCQASPIPRDRRPPCPILNSPHAGPPPVDLPCLQCLRIPSEPMDHMRLVSAEHSGTRMRPVCYVLRITKACHFPHRENGSQPHVEWVWDTTPRTFVVPF